MPGLLSTIEELFATKNLYDVLEITKDSDQTQIKKAYHKKSLKVHPDRASPEQREEATRKFQALGAVYKLLSDENSRALYDESGEIDEENDSIDPDRDWSDYWRILFKKVTVDDIKNFEEKYRNSKEEEEDLRKAYLASEGNMEQIIDTVLCATAEDEARFAETIWTWIRSEEVPAYQSFTQESKENKKQRKNRRKKEAEEAEAHAKELGLDKSDESLMNLIMQRNQKRAAEADSFFDHLAAKYGGQIGRAQSELQSHHDLVCRLLLEKKKNKKKKKR